ncbi:MAG: site-2 protease family protein [Oscillospiraceae bacterium]|nr:site-2 protease family protein [Oscillospiraceae bacterium]
MNLSTEKILEYFVRLTIILLINPLHECAHAWSAHKLGDDTAKQKGRMTLSPFAHIDPYGALLLLSCGFGWAKPVPVNARNFKNPRKDMMLTAIVGPISNLVAALIGMIAYRILGSLMYDTIYYFILFYFIMINIDLCVFNMLPVPPLDGSRLVTYLLPTKAAFWFIKNERFFYGIVMLLMITGILSMPLDFLSGLIFQGLVSLTSWIPAVF